MKALFFLLISFQVYAHDWPATYRYQVLVSDKTTSTVTKESFEFIPHLIVNLMNPSVRVKTDWEKPYFTAWAALEEDKSFQVSFWGGLARIPGMSDEGHALVACHELGHIMGGTPKIKIKEFLWSSAEGQSDYFATGVCLKKYFAMKNRMEKFKEPSVSPTGWTLCRTTYDSLSDFQICLQVQKGIESFAKLLTHLTWYENTYSIETPSPVAVKETLFDSYPEPQCRIDTLLQGSLCPLEQYPCSNRPACWFKN